MNRKARRQVAASPRYVRDPEGAVLQGRGNFEMAPDTDIRRADPVDDAHDRLYTLYNAEAEKYDAALTGRLKTGMESLLIFAGLFSATVTALLIESYPMLTADSGDVMIFYLAQITQQIATTSPGQTQNTTIPVPPVFVPAPSAVRINILWVLSLIFSLACALGATLIQTWTNRYTRLVGKFAPPTHRALQREFFFEGIKESQLILVAEGLPALLHISLFLFLVGLIEFFLPINQDVAHAILIIVIAIAVVYTALTISPLIAGKSPYRTPFTPHFPRRVVRFCQRLKDAYLKMTNPSRKPGSPRRTSVLLRKTRALQWLLNQTTGVRGFDQFLEGIEPFLDTLAGNAAVVYQLNVNDAASMEARSTFTLTAHIGYRLFACIDNSMFHDIRMAQAAKYTRVLWLLFGHAGDRLSLLDDSHMVAPGGIARRVHWCPTTSHMQHWLNRDTLRSLRRLRSGRYGVDVSIHASCASAAIASHLVHGLSSMLQDNCLFRVPKSWGILKLLAHCDTFDEAQRPLEDADWSSSFELDALTTCLLDPPMEPLGSMVLSRADRDLRNYEAVQREPGVPSYRARSSSEFPHNPQHPPVTSLHSLSVTHIENSCRLAILNVFLSRVSTATPTEATPVAIDIVHKTILLLVDGLSASNAEPSAQEVFVGHMQNILNLLSNPWPSPLLSKQAADATIPVLRTLDDPIWGPKARELNRAQLGIDTNATYILRSNVGPPHIQLRLAVSQAKAVVFRPHLDSELTSEDFHWQLARVEEYWTIRHITTGRFLNIDTMGASDTSVLSTSTTPAHWDAIFAIPLRRVDSSYCRFFYGDTQYSIGFGQHSEVEIERAPVTLSRTNSSAISFALTKVTPVHPAPPPHEIPPQVRLPYQAEIRARGHFYGHALRSSRRIVSVNAHSVSGDQSRPRRNFSQLMDDMPPLVDPPATSPWGDDQGRPVRRPVVRFQEDMLLNDTPPASFSGRDYLGPYPSGFIPSHGPV